VLDEPTNGLDPQGTREVRTLVRELAAEGCTVLVSSHLLAEIEQMCDRVTVMRAGRVVAAGTLQELALLGPAVRRRGDARPRAGRGGPAPARRELGGARRRRPARAGELPDVPVEDVTRALVPGRRGRARHRPQRAARSRSCSST
jgi:ABC-type glutathione transport system ATPase component